MGCFGSKEAATSDELVLSRKPSQRGEKLKQKIREGGGLDGNEVRGSIYSPTRVPSKPSLKYPGSMRRAKISVEGTDTANMNDEAIISVRPISSPSTASPYPSPVSLQMVNVDRPSIEDAPDYPLLGIRSKGVAYRGTGQEIDPADEQDGIIHGTSDPGCDISFHGGLGAGSGSGRFGAGAERQRTISLNGLVSPWDVSNDERTMSGGPTSGEILSSRMTDRTMSERPVSLGHLKRIPSVRLAVMGKVQEPGEWQGGPSSVDRESKLSNSSSIRAKRSSSRLGMNSPRGSARGSVVLSSKSRSDLADLAHI